MHVTPDAVDRLQQWIDRSRVTQREAADMFGFDHTYLSQILNRRRQPGLANAIRIERVTGIAVEAWLPTTDGGTADEAAAPVAKVQTGKA